MSETESETHPTVPLILLSLSNWQLRPGVNAGDEVTIECNEILSVSVKSKYFMVWKMVSID